MSRFKGGYPPRECNLEEKTTKNKCNFLIICQNLNFFFGYRHEQPKTKVNSQRNQNHG